MTKVYECRWSIEEDRPEIDFEDSRNAKNEWLAIAYVLDGLRPFNEFPENVRITVSHPDATQWDCYMDGGARGLFSRRFLEVIGLHALRGLSALPATLNDATYYFLRCDQPIDCLDRTNSNFEMFRSDPTSISR